MDDSPDDELVGQIAAGNADAFTSLFRRRRRDVYRFALHMTGSAATAEDVTQDVFVVVMRDSRRFNPERAAVLAWLCGIARNHVRRRLERDRFIQPLEEDTPSPAADVDPLGALAQEQRVAALRRAVMSLPVRYREAVVLCDLQEMSYADAAAVVECAVGTIRSRLHRGRAMLAAKLRDATTHDSSTSIRNSRCFA